MYNSFMYIVFNDGVNTEEYYPYTGLVSLHCCMACFQQHIAQN